MRAIRIAAVLAAAVFILSAVVVLTPGTVSQSTSESRTQIAASEGGRPTVASNPSYYAELSNDLAAYGAASEIPALGELPLAVVQEFLNANLAPGSTGAQIVDADLTAYSASSGLQVAFNWGTLLGSALGGCAGGALVGGLIGAAAAGVGALPGAAIGCAAGAVAGALGSYITQEYDKQTNKESYSVADAAAANEMRLVNQEAQAVSALLPATEYFWYRLADIAAMNQIGNSTFNATLDLEQSTLLVQLGSVSSSIIAEMNQVESVYEQFAAANGNDLAWENQGGGYSMQANGEVAYVGMTADVPLYVFAGSQWDAYSSSPYTDGVCGAGTTFGPYTVSAGNPGVTLTQCSGYHIGTTGYNEFQIVGAATGNGVIESTNSTDTPWVDSAVPFCSSTPCSTYSVDSSWAALYDTVTSATPLSSVSISSVNTVLNQIPGIEANAVVSAQTYYQYLRDLGYTNPADIPAKFQILPPYEAMPSDLCLDNASVFGGLTYSGACVNLNFTEFNSLYLAWLASLAEFFNSTTYQNGPSPCSPASTCTTWGNLNEYGEGSIYIPDAAPGNSTYGSEVFGNPATWNVTDKQLLFFPEVVPESIPVGETWEVPSNGELQVYVVQEGYLLSLVGNGTPVATVAGTSDLMPATSTAGDAIYLTGCTYDGTAATACNVEPYSVNVTVTQLLCSYNSSACPTPPAGGGGVFSLSGALCGLIGFFGLPCTGAAGLITGAVLLILIVAVVAVALYVVYRAASGKRGGSGGTTVEVVSSRRG